MQKLTCAALFLSVVFSCLAARSEEIHLKDGTKINGTIVALNDGTFQVKTAYGDIQIPLQQILSINFPENEANSAAGAQPAGGASPAIDESLESGSYTNRTAAFHMIFPAGWVLAPDVRTQSKDIVAALTSADQTLIFLVTPEKFAGTLATYQVLAETQFQMKFKDYEKLSQSDTEIDGRKGVKLIWHAKNPAANDAPLKGVVYIIPYDGRMVRLTFLCLEPLFDPALPVFEKIALSYQTVYSTK